MSDIPYSVRDKNVRINAIKGFNFADIETNEMFKKVDDNNVGGTGVFATAGNLTTTGSVNCNDLNISGTLGVGTPSNVGTAGALLTSNGSGAAVSWNRPYFMKARVNSNYNIDNFTDPIEMTEDDLGSNNYNSGDFLVDAWTCPQTGIYRVKTCITAKSQSPDELRHLSNITKLQSNTGVDIRNITDTICLPGGQDESELEEVSVPAESIEHINSGEKVKLYTYFVVGSGTRITIGGKPNAAKTYMIIERII